MRILTLAVAAAGIAGLMVTTMASPAEAQRRQQRVEYYSGDRVYTVRSAPRSRVVVQRRSYLDAGTEVLPGERKYTDYAIPYGYSPVSSILGPSFGYDRRPLNDPWDVPQRW